MFKIMVSTNYDEVNVISISKEILSVVTIIMYVCKCKEIAHTVYLSTYIKHIKVMLSSLQCYLYVTMDRKQSVHFDESVCDIGSM